jgi:transcriptional regulator with PAS, ATPase and Fis domain
MKTQEHWYDEVSFPVTVCDREGVIVEMNQQSISEFEPDGGANLLGASLLDCHPEPARLMLQNMLKSQNPHTYISKSDGKTELVHQTPWFINGEYQGFVEIIIALPEPIEIKGD